LFVIDQMKGYESILQLLSRYVQQISIVLRPDLTMLAKPHECLLILHKQQVHLLILHNLEVLKPHMRKSYLNLYLTEPQ